MSPMLRKSGSFSFAFLALPALATALFLDLCIQARTFTILDHGFRPNPLRFTLLAAAAFFLLALEGIVVARDTAAHAGGDIRTAFFKGLPSFWPLCLFFLSPLLPAHYLTRDDLVTRLFILGALAAGGTLGLVLCGLRRIRRYAPERRSALLSRFETMPRRKKIVFLFFAAWIVYNLAVFVLVAQGVTFSGDEPNYLITTESLYSDGDINLRNNYAEQDYFHFYSKKDNPKLRLGIYGRNGRKGPEQIFPINLPGISVLMLPFYALSQAFTGKLLTFILKGSLSIWAALLGVQIYLYAADRWKSEKLSLALWGIASFTAPVLFYAIHLYPEIPVAFMSLLVFRRVSSEKPLRTAELLGLGFLLSTFIWFGVKFNLVFWPLLLVSAYHLLTSHKIRGRLAAFLAFPVISTALFYVYIHTLYGTFSPFSIYEGVMTAEQFSGWKSMVLSIPLRERLDAFFDYFLDQRDGLLLYAPFFAFAFLGFVEMFRKAKKDFFALAVIALPFVLNYGFFTHRQGYSPQARVLAPLSWIAIIAIGWFLVQNRKPAFSKAFRICVLIAAAFAVLLLAHPSFLYEPTTHEFTERPGDLFAFLGNMRVFPAERSAVLRQDRQHEISAELYLARGASRFHPSLCFRKNPDERETIRKQDSFPRISPSRIRPLVLLSKTIPLPRRRSHGFREEDDRTPHFHDGQGRHHQAFGRHVSPRRKKLPDSFQLTAETRTGEGRLRFGKGRLPRRCPLLRSAAFYGQDIGTNEGAHFRAAGFRPLPRPLCLRNRRQSREALG